MKRCESVGWLAQSHVIVIWTHFLDQSQPFCVSLNLSCRQLRALYYVTMDSSIKGRALTRIVIFSLSLAGLTLRRSLGNLEIMGCAFSRNEALSFRKRRKVSKVQINLNFSQNSVRMRAFPGLFVQTVFILKRKPVRLYDVNAHAIQIWNLREI